MTGRCVTLGSGNQASKRTITMETCDISARDQVRSHDTIPSRARHEQVWSYTDLKQVKHLKYCLEPLINGEDIIATICKGKADKSYQPQQWMYKVSRIFHIII